MDREIETASARTVLDEVCGHDRLDRAVHDLERRFPDASARRRVTLGQIGAIGAAIALIAAAFTLAPAIALETAHWLFFAVFAAAVLLRAGAAIASLVPPRPAPEAAGPLPTYALLAPLHREAAIVADTLAALRALDYPADRLDILLVLEADDAETIAAASIALARAPGPGRIVLVPAGSPRTKPKALNYALLHTKAELIGVYDAEDRPDPAQLRAAVNAFAAGGPQLACVQAPLLIDNAKAGWLPHQFAAEYAIHFHQLVPFLCRLGLAPPLGGTSNHFRREALEAVGAWDAFNVTEDADLGYRLAVQGYRIGAIAPPTYEEAPPTLALWMPQRARWLKGHIQTWLVLMRAPLRTAKAMGVANFFAMQLVLAGGVAAAFVHAPLIALAALSLLPGHHAAPLDVGLLASGYSVAIAAALCAAWTTRAPGVALAGLTMPLYWPLAFLAGLRALIEFIARPHYWAKTDHALTARDIH